MNDYIAFCIGVVVGIFLPFIIIAALVLAHGDHRPHRDYRNPYYDE